MSASKYKKNLLINFNEIKKTKKFKTNKIHQFRSNSFWIRTHKNTIIDLNINTRTDHKHKEHNNSLKRSLSLSSKASSDLSLFNSLFFFSSLTGGGGGVIARWGEEWVAANGLCCLPYSASHDMASLSVSVSRKF